MGGIVGLGGGTGASRLWCALAAADGAGPLTLVVSTADSLWQHGLRICPDINTVLYALSGRLDPERGWGIRDDSFRCMAALAGLGESPGSGSVIWTWPPTCSGRGCSATGPRSPR